MLLCDKLQFKWKKAQKEAFDNRLISDDDIEFGQLRALLYGYS